MEVIASFIFLTLAVTEIGYVHADEPPDIKTPAPAEIPPVHFKLYSSLTLPCTATGVPSPTYKWIKDGQNIAMTGRYIHELKEGYMELQNLSSEDAGDYQCIASNKGGSSLSQVFKLRMATLGHFQSCQTVKRHERQVGQYLDITKGNISSTPPPTYTWWVASSPSGDNIHRVNRSKRIVQDLEGNLYFTSLLPEDMLEGEQVYRLEAVNTVTGEHTTGCNTVVTLEQGSIKEGKPVMIYKSDDKDVLEGAQMKIQCIFIGSQNIDVTWSAPTPQYTTEEAGTVLVVSSMSPSAEGQYTCVGTNAFDQYSDFITVSMQEPPKFMNGGKPVRQVLTEGETATFTCQTKPNQRSHVTTAWMINGKPLSELEDNKKRRIEVDHIQQGTKLVIRVVRREEDTMVVQCKASNAHGTLYANAPLIVLAQPTLLSSVGWTVVSAVPLTIAAAIIIYCVTRRGRRLQRVNENVVDPKSEYGHHNLLPVPVPQSGIQIIDLTERNPASDLYVNCAQGPYDLINAKDIQNPETPVQEETKKEGDCEYIDQRDVEPRIHHIPKVTVPKVPRRRQEQKKVKYTPDHYLLMEGDVPKVKEDS